MRGLIRPVLFAIARLGLSLAVVVWIGGLFVGCAWRFRSFGRTVELSVQSSLIKLSQHDGSKFGSVEPDWSVRTPHWLTVAVFIAFNLTLHFIYRNRPETQPCDS